MRSAKAPANAKGGCRTETHEPNWRLLALYHAPTRYYKHWAICAVSVCVCAHYITHVPSRCLLWYSTCRFRCFDANIVVLFDWVQCYRHPQSKKNIGLIARPFIVAFFCLHALLSCDPNIIHTASNQHKDTNGQHKTFCSNYVVFVITVATNVATTTSANKSSPIRIEKRMTTQMQPEQKQITHVANSEWPCFLSLSYQWSCRNTFYIHCKNNTCRCFNRIMQKQIEETYEMVFVPNR